MLLIISTLLSCNNNNQTEEIAENLCSCLRPIAEVYNDTKNLSEEDSAEVIQDAMQRMEQAAAESDDCANRMNEKFGDLSDQQEEVEAAMQRTCPEIVGVMNEIESDL